MLPLVAATLFLAYSWGRSASLLYVAAMVGAVTGIAILRQPRLGLLALIVAALAAPFPIGTGTEVQLNPAAVLVPLLFGVWLLSAAVQGRLRLPPSPVNLPLVLFLLAGLLSLGVGLVTWDSLVPRRPSFIVVQLAQWAIFVFSALAFWLMAVFAQKTRWLQRVTVVFLSMGGGLALLRIFPSLQPIFNQVSTGAVDRAPFWLLLSALAGGQLIFNRQLRRPAQLALAVILLMAIYYAFFLEREGASTWLGIAVAGAVLVWLRFPRLRGIIMILLILLIVLGVLFPTVYEFAGGDEEWDESGNSRLVLIGRVMEVAMRNPITGLGPAAYRPYANMKPLLYGRAFWIAPQINSHNNYVDLFAHGGILGLALLTWFGVAYGRLGLHLHRRHPGGFAGGYVAAMLAAGAGALVIMMLADWLLPFVYNIGFHGFQASVLMWLFWGGLVAIDQMDACTKPRLGE